MLKVFLYFEDNSSVLVSRVQRHSSKSHGTRGNFIVFESGRDFGHHHHQLVARHVIPGV